MICWRRFHFCAIKSNKGFIIFVSYCPRMQFYSIKFMSDDIVILVTFTAWFVIAFVSIVGYSLNEMTSL